MTAEVNLRQLQPQLMPVSQIQERAGPCRKVKRQHLDRIAEKGSMDSFQNGLVDEPLSVQAAMIPEAKAAVEKG